MEIKQTKEEKDTKYELTQEQQNEMAKFFLQIGQGKMYKQAEKASQFIFRRMKQISQQQVGDKPQKMLTIYVGCYEDLKDSRECSEVFVFGCLIFGILKTRTLKVCFEADVNINKRNKKSDNCVTMYVKNRKNIDLGKRLSEYIQNMLRNEKMQLKKKFNYFGEFFIKCQSQKIQLNSNNVPTLRFLREGIYSFIDEIYLNINQLWQGKYLLFFLIEGLDLLNLISKYKTDYSTHGIFLYFGNDIQNCELISFKIINVRDGEFTRKKTYGRYNGYYCPFNGKPFEYLKILKIYSTCINNLSSVQNIIKSMPNLQFLYIQRQGTQIVIQSIDRLLDSLIINNSLIRAFVLKNITVTKVSSQILKRLLYECPFLVNLELNLIFRFQIEETYTWSGQEERQIKQQERDSQTILKVMRIRALTFDINRDMIKLIQHEGFDFNTALQAVYCLQPKCL